jgi:hypothetical protein
VLHLQPTETVQCLVVSQHLVVVAEVVAQIKVRSLILDKDWLVLLVPVVVEDKQVA